MWPQKSHVLFDKLGLRVVKFTISFGASTKREMETIDFLTTYLPYETFWTESVVSAREKDRSPEKKLKALMPQPYQDSQCM